MSITAAFSDAFGAPPGACGSAPGRVNLIGEHIDYNGGLVLPAALPQRVEVAMGRRGDGKVAVHAARFGETHVRPADDPAAGHWTDYAVGALAKAHAFGWIPAGMSLCVESQIPDGAGVSSSAALITAILRAAAAFAGVTPDPTELALAARAVENDYIGMPCGIMDQMAVGLCDPGRALALDTASLAFELVDIPAGWRFEVIHSGISRKLSDGRYKQRFEEAAEARARLGAQWLCHLNAEQQTAALALPENLRKRTAHVTSEHQRVVSAVAAMKAGDLAGFARLMNESHASYSADFEASTPEIDALIDAAVRFGAKAARLTGGGFGGCVVALVEAGHEHVWSQSLLAAYPQAWRVTAP